MRYFCGDIDAVQCFATKAPGRDDLVHRLVQHAVRERRGGPPDQQLRHRARAPDGAVRGGRHEGPLRDRGHVARGHALSRGRPGQVGLHEPRLRRLPRFRRHVPRAPVAASRARSRMAWRRSASMARARTAWKPRGSSRPASAAWKRAPWCRWRRSPEAAAPRTVRLREPPAAPRAGSDDGAGAPPHARACFRSSCPRPTGSCRPR